MIQKLGVLNSIVLKMRSCRRLLRLILYNDARAISWNFTAIRCTTILETLEHFRIMMAQLKSPHPLEPYEHHRNMVSRVLSRGLNCTPPPHRPKAYFITGFPIATDLGQLEADFRILYKIRDFAHDVHKLVYNVPKLLEINQI